MGNRQERKHRRFHLECQVHVKFQAANSIAEVETVSKNVSIGGLLVHSALVIPEHTPVTFIMCVRGEQAVHPVYLAGEGKIARAESTGAGFAIAIKCTIPITDLENCLPEASM
jgi:hypothetical protein